MAGGWVAGGGAGGGVIADGGGAWVGATAGVGGAFDGEVGARGLDDECAGGGPDELTFE